MKSRDPKLDAQLRAVPLPEGLIERLRQTALADDDGLDAALRELPLPGGLLDCLRDIPLAADEDFDDALRHVALPAGLVKRLRRIPWDDDEGLDAAIRDVPVPATLAAPWQRRLKGQRRLVRLIQVVAAASVLLVIASLYYFGQHFGGLLATDGTDHGDRPHLPPRPRIVANQPEEKLTTSIAGQDPARIAPLWRPDVPNIPLSPSDREAIHRSPSDPGGAPVPSNVDLLADFHHYSERQPLGIGPGAELFDPLPNVRLMRGGMEWPSPVGYWFLIKHHTHPFVSPAADPRLQSLVVPLGVDGTSYELTRQYLHEKQLPPPERVRVEDFLASVDYNFPQPTQQALGLSLSGGPSPFGGEGLQLLQVGVQAGHVVGQPHPPAHLVLAVDTSANMRWGGRMDAVQRALKQFSQRLDAGDRLSLVGFGDNALVLIEDVGVGEVDQFAAAVNSLSAKGSGNLSEGLGKAYDVARQASASGRPAVRVVLLTGSMVDLAAESAAQLQQQAAQGAARGVPLHVIDLSQQEETDPQLQKFAEAGHGAVHAAANADQVRWALREVISGQSQVVARDAQLRVTFNPKLVLEYRLLGHEATLLAGLLPEHPRADFHDGQWATALYEVRLAPGAGGEVATAELCWYDGDQPRPEGQRRLQQGIDSRQFAASFNDASPSLQEAALVAQAAEVLRKSFFVRTPRMALALARVWQLASQVDSRLYHRPSFVDFVAMVQQATTAKAAPSQEKARRRSMH